MYSQRGIVLNGILFFLFNLKLFNCVQVLRKTYTISLRQYYITKNNIYLAIIIVKRENI